MATLLETTGGVVAIAAVVLPVLTTIAVYIVRLCLRIWNSYAIVSRIAEEFRPNGGGSIRDRIDAIGTALEENAAWSSITLTLIPHSVFKSDDQGGFTWVSRHLADELDMIPEEIMGFGWLNSVAWPERDKVRDEWFAAIDDIRNVKMDYTTSDGRDATLEAHPYVNKKDKSLRGHIGSISFRGSFIGR